MQKQTAAPEGTAAWEPPFLTRKMLRLVSSTMRAKQETARLSPMRLRSAERLRLPAMPLTMRAFDPASRQG